MEKLYASLKFFVVFFVFLVALMFVVKFSGEKEQKKFISAAEVAEKAPEKTKNTASKELKDFVKKVVKKKEEAKKAIPKKKVAVQKPKKLTKQMAVELKKSGEDISSRSIAVLKGALAVTTKKGLSKVVIKTKSRDFYSKIKTKLHALGLSRKIETNYVLYKKNKEALGTVEFY